MHTDDPTNDQTIGRTNVVSRGGIPSIPTPATSQPSRDTAAVDSENRPATSTAAATLRENAASGGAFDWPTSAEHYQLINRVGQGAFASVWRARLIDNTGKPDEEKAGDEDIQCAIKIMDLEHVNINISGESFDIFAFESWGIFELAENRFRCDEVILTPSYRCMSTAMKGPVL
jgi:serine/threonine protein kinase